MDGKKEISTRLIEAAGSVFSLTEVTPREYAAMKYPKLLPVMRFTVRQYRAEGFGSIAAMDTRAMGGLMKLSTIVFTPNTGKNVPFLLIDTMEMKKKRLVYVEYYDCTEKGAELPGAEGQSAEFAALPDYAEKPAWYVERRTPYSLIKGGEGASWEALEEMTAVCAGRYLQAAAAAGVRQENLAGLKAFQRDMCELGNPSTGTMSKVLGDEGARRFFTSVIMPV